MPFFDSLTSELPYVSNVFSLQLCGADISAHNDSAITMDGVMVCDQPVIVWLMVVSCCQHLILSSELGFCRLADSNIQHSRLKRTCNTTTKFLKHNLENISLVATFRSPTATFVRLVVT